VGVSIDFFFSDDVEEFNAQKLGPTFEIPTFASQKEMNAEEWEKVTKNMDELLDVYPSIVIEHLFSANVITLRDKKSIQSTRDTEKQMKNTLKILKEKPSQHKAFGVLIEALRQDPVTCLLADKIVGTEAKSDANLHSKPDPHLLDDDVRRVLRANYVNEVGSSTPLSDIRQTLKEARVFGGQNEWDNETLLNFIWKDEFVGVEIERAKKREGKNAKRVIYLKNIRKLDLEAEIPIMPKQKEHQTLAVAETLQDVCQKDVQNMTPSELRKYLTTKFEHQGLETIALEDLEAKNVSGQVFLSLKEEDFKEEIPTASFGVRRFLLLLKEQHIQPSEIKSLPEHLRTFDTEVRPADKYFLNRCADIVSTNIRGKRTSPLKHFLLIEKQDKEKALEFIGSEVVPFAAACLNERRNGTIYFGISPPDNSNNYKAGEIVGVDLEPEDVQAEINDFIRKSFLEAQKNIISCTVRDAKFVPVIGATSKNVHVIEVDIVASSAALGDETIRTKLSLLPLHLKKHKGKDGVFKFSENGLPKIVSTEEMCNYEKDQPRIVEQRRQDESHTKCTNRPNLRKRMLNLLTAGEETMQDQVFPFLMTSPIDSHMDMSYLLENTPFIKQLQPEIVFDFDPTGASNGIYKSLDSEQEVEMRVVTTDNFDKTQQKPEDYTNLKESLANENRITWMFCNGYSEDFVAPMSPTEWNRKRRGPFQEALNFFIDNFNNFDKDRIIFIICLFSKNYDAMIEACDEVLTKLPDNWLLLAETEEVAKLWQDQILLRNRVEKKDLIDRCIIGMHWGEINTTIMRVTKVIEEHECILPCSTGTFAEIREKKLKDWCDLGVLSAADFHFHDGALEKSKKEVEEKFYRGQQVDWLNFYFHNQVLKRDIHDELMKNVKDALNGQGKDEEDKITIVPLLHQPGAGGTTSAKQVLWDLRKEYRCCVINTITDQTCDQLDELRRFNDPTPQPLLIFIDNEDEDRCIKLQGSLEDKGRKRWRDSDESFDVYCTIILCIRRPSLPKQLKHGHIALRQELTKRELDWFKEKNDSLTTRFEKNGDTNINPKFLISFNILRENFNKEYVSKVVKEFSDDVSKENEVKLLKVVSLLNTYDPDFKYIQVSCLDKILEDLPTFRKSQAKGPLTRNIKWEATLSQAVKVLLNVSSTRNQHGKTRQSLRVFNKVIAREILTRMKERTNQRESEIMLELMESGVFEQESSDSKLLQVIINNVMKKREFKSDGIKKQKFSQFVLYVQHNEGADVAVNLLECLFEHNQDPFTAQLVARFYIDLKNWSQAEKYAKKATSMLTTNSFLWDTYGQVFKNQLYDKIDSEKTLDKGEGFKVSELHEMIDFSEKCIECFRKEQKISELETTSNGENNFAGYFGELRAIVLLLSALKLCPAFGKDDILHRYLVETKFKPMELDFLTERESVYLKSLEKNSKDAMRRLDEEYLQMKGNVNLVISTPSFDFDKSSLLVLKVNLDAYFGEPYNDVPRNLNEKERNDYRYRRARNLGATSLTSLLQMKQNRECETLKQIYELMYKNVSSEINSFDNLRAIMDTVTVLMLDQVIPKGLNYQQILEWSRKLYSLEKLKSTERPYLEPYLYFVLYNFPTEERQSHKLCLPIDLSSALNSWQEVFKKKYPKYGGEELSLKRRETTLFFLGNGEPLKDIVHQDSLDFMRDYTLHEKWQLPQVRAQLRLLSGTLNNFGEKVTLRLVRDGNTFPLTILTSHRVTKKQMWLKRVYFYVGFSFSGPRAFGMSTDEPGASVQHVPRSRPPATTQVSKQRQHSPPILAELVKARTNTEKELKKHKVIVQ
ncbi:unnamed protein product, partial [Lymnaea stagnalis]